VQASKPCLPALDRAAPLRKNPEALESRLDDPQTLLVPVWRNRVLVSLGDVPAPLPLTVAQSSALMTRNPELAWLGMLGQNGCFAADISGVDDPLADPALSGLGRFDDLRIVGSLLHPQDFGLLAFARGILHFHRQHRYCGRCGEVTRAREGGHIRECGGCQTKHFPRTDPAVMMLVTRGDRCLLARQPAFPSGMYSALAGFVEPGETIEECVVRETFEEVGIGVSGLTYFRSQAWPFPQSLMIGYFARADSDEFKLDPDELEAARWFHRDELRSPEGFFYPPAVSLAHHMIRAFVEGSG
jgi:NAD+ diphosphatase